MSFHLISVQSGFTGPVPNLYNKDYGPKRENIHIYIYIYAHNIACT